MIPGMGGLGNMMELLKHAGKLRGQVEELKNLIVEGSAGGGMVRVRVSGKLEMVDCKIEPHVFADKDAEMLEDLVVAATNQALKKMVEAWMAKTGLAPGSLPGLSDLFGASGGGPAVGGGPAAS